jgi:hypothetical protein
LIVHVTKGEVVTSVLEDERTVPAPGQLATVRNQPWIATDVVRSEVVSNDPNLFSAARHTSCGEPHHRRHIADQERFWATGVSPVARSTPTYPGRDAGAI